MLGGQVDHTQVTQKTSQFSRPEDTELRLQVHFGRFFLQEFGSRNGSEACEISSHLLESPPGLDQSFRFGTHVDNKSTPKFIMIVQVGRNLLSREGILFGKQVGQKC